MISIIIPTLNEEDYLPELLKSLKSQDFKDYEIIVADANSQDKTRDVARKFGCVITEGGTPGIGRNRGADIAQGELFLFLDADNKLSHKDFLKKSVEEFKEKNLVVASFPIYPSGHIIDRIAYIIYNFWVNLSQKFLPHATNSILATRQIHIQIRGFNEDIMLAEDHDYARRAALHGKFGFIKNFPIFTSSRRFVKEGRMLTYFKYLAAGLYLLLVGPIKSDIFSYKLEGFLKKKSK